MERRNIVLEKSYEFALIIIEFSEQLEQLKKFVIARQLLKSGTSIGANISEAQSSESKADFIHKLKIAAKEAEETKYWLMLCKLSPSYPFNESLISKLDEIQKLLSSIISISKHNDHGLNH
jgi:four helix bundle protein